MVLIELEAAAKTTLPSNHDATATIHAAVPPILYGIVASAWKSSCDFGPSLSHLCDQLLNKLAFLRCDRLMAQSWLQVLMIPLPALFRGSRYKELRNLDPIMSTVHIDKAQQRGILELRPRSSFGRRSHFCKLLIRQIMLQIRQPSKDSRAIDLGDHVRL